MGREEEGRLRPVAKKDPELRSLSLQYTHYAFPEKVFYFPSSHVRNWLHFPLIFLHSAVPH